jgi:CubicO group peptidase (beta-lactamase class C family)
LGELYLGRGTLHGRRILQPSTVELLTTPQAPGPLREKRRDIGLGWNLCGPTSAEITELAPPGSFSHGGGTHCYLLVCPALDLVAVKLLNRGYWPGDFDHAGDYRRFGKLVIDAIVSLDERNPMPVTFNLRSQHLPKTQARPRRNP